MKIKFLLLTAATALLALAPAFTSASAQTTYKQRHTIAKRSANQQARIQHGVADGQITPRGAAAAEHNQSRITNQDARMRSRDDGHLTSADRHKLASEQNATSRGIYDRNHNQYADPGVTPNTPR